MGGSEECDLWIYPWCYLCMVHVGNRFTAKWHKVEQNGPGASKPKLQKRGSPVPMSLDDCEPRFLVSELQTNVLSNLQQEKLGMSAGGRLIGSIKKDIHIYIYIDLTIYSTV